MNFTSYFDQGMTLRGYLKMTDDLLEQGKTTGPNQSEPMIHYTKLNLQRSKRWLKKMDDVMKDINVPQNKHQKWLVLSEPWCGDAAHALPFLQSLADKSGISMRIVLRDENEDLMNQFLTNRGKSIPKLIAFDDRDELLFHWGPRPEPLQNWFLKAKEKNTDYEEIFDYLQKFYNKDAGKLTVQEIIKLMDPK